MIWDAHYICYLVQFYSAVKQYDAVDRHTRLRINSPTQFLTIENEEGDAKIQFCFDFGWCKKPFKWKCMELIFLHLQNHFDALLNMD